MVTLCVSTAAASCGRAGLENAIAHATQRAAALHIRQRVTVQRDRTLGAYYLIRSVHGA